MRWVVVAALVVSCGVGLADELPWNTNEIKTLTVEQAEVLAKHEGGLYLNGLTAITPEVAEALAKHQGELDISGLTTITPEVAEALALHKGSLRLMGINKLSPEVAASLAKHLGPELNLRSLIELSPEAAESLSKYKGMLYLDGLTHLTPQLAEKLGGFQGDLSLSSLDELTSAAVASKLADPGTLSLSVKSITPDVLRALTKPNQDISFWQLKVTPELAKILVTHDGSVSLGRVTPVSTEVANILRRNPRIAWAGRWVITCKNGHRSDGPSHMLQMQAIKEGRARCGVCKSPVAESNLQER